MARSSFTSADPNTPWWYETPSLASQSSYGQSTFTGATISQLTDPFSETCTTASDSSCFGETSEGGEEEQEEDSDEETGSFLITTVESDTGQSSFSLSSDYDGFVQQAQKQRSFGIEHPRPRLEERSASLSRNRHPNPLSSQRATVQQPQHTTTTAGNVNSAGNVTSTNSGKGNDFTVSNRDPSWASRDRSGSLGSKEQKKDQVKLRRQGSGETAWNNQTTRPLAPLTTPTNPPTTSGSQGVVSFTVNCSIHLHPDAVVSSEVERSNSKTDLKNLRGPQYTNACPSDVTMVTGLNGEGHASVHPLMITDHHSTITEEGSTDLSGLLNPERTALMEGATSDCSDNLTPISLSSDCSGESALSHSMSSANQDILNYLRPEIMQYMNPNELLPHLKERDLLSKEDVKYLTNPRRTDKEKRRRILACAPSCDFDRFVECLFAEKNDSGHVYLTRRFREAIEKKRNNPFKRLSSLRHKGRKISTSKSSPSALPKDKERRPSPRSSSTPSPVTPTSTTPRTVSTATPRFLSNSVRKTSVDKVPYNPALESLPLHDSHDETDSFGYETFTLPRKSTSNLVQDSRGTKPYSSARYVSTSTRPGDRRKRSKVTRHGSFQGAADRHVHVSPMSRDPYKLSEDNSDILENLSHFTTTVFDHPLSPTHNGNAPDTHYYNVVNDAFPDSKDHSLLESKPKQSRSSVELGGRDSIRRAKKVSDPSPYSTIPEIISETTEVSNNIQQIGNRRPSLPTDSRSKYPSLSVGRFSSNATPSEMSKRQQQPTSPVGKFDPTSPFSTEVEQVRHSSLRRDSPRREPGSAKVRRGVSLHGVMESPSRHYPALNYEGSYMPSALSPVHTSPEGSLSPNEKAPPVPVKQMRTHRRAQSYDVSQTSTDFVDIFPPANLPRPLTSSNHLSLRRNAPQNPNSFNSSTNISEDPSHVTIVSTQDSGITSTFDGQLRSASGYSLSSSGSSATQRRARDEMGIESLTWRKFEWLQEKVHFKKAPEDIVFNSYTHYNQPREIIYSGILYEHGRPKFLILLTDMLLIVKPKKKGSILPGRLASMLSAAQVPHVDWFSDLECIAKMPLLLHHLSVRSLSKRKEPQVLYLHYDNQSEMRQITLHTVSKEAKDIWVDTLNTAIVACTRAQAMTVLPVGNIIQNLPTSTSYSKLGLTIVEANNLAVLVDCETRNHFCTVQLGDKKCKTPNVKAQCWPSWQYKFEFVDFALTETVLIEFYTERITSPDEFLGCIDIQLMAVAQRLKVNMSQGVSTLQLKNQHLPLKNGKGTLTLDFELGWENKNSSLP